MNNANNSSAKKSRKLKRKFNIVDFLILVLVLTVVGTTIYAVISWSNIKRLWSTSTVSLQYVVELRGVDADFINNIKAGDSVTDSVTKTNLGTVDRVESIEKHKVLDYYIPDDKTDEYVGVLSEYDDKYNVTVYISSTAEYEKGIGYTINGRRVAIGEVLNLRFPKFASTAYCIAGNFN